MNEKRTYIIPIYQLQYDHAMTLVYYNYILLFNIVETFVNKLNFLLKWHLVERSGECNMIHLIRKYNFTIEMEHNGHHEINKMLW